MTDLTRPPTPLPSGFRERPAKVLIIDDEVFVRDALSLALSDEATVDAAIDGREGLARIASRERYELVLCDLVLPDMSGMELHRQLEATLPAEANRLVFMTRGIPLAHVRAYLAGVLNLCIKKPVDVEALRDLIRDRLRQSIDAQRARTHGT